MRLHLQCVALCAAQQSVSPLYHQACVTGPRFLRNYGVILYVESVSYSILVEVAEDTLLHNMGRGLLSDVTVTSTMAYCLAY